MPSLPICKTDRFDFGSIQKLVSVILIVFLIIVSPLWSLPTYKEVKSQYIPSDIQVFDRSGDLIQRYRIRNDYRSEEWTEYNLLPKFLIDSVVHAEDKRFFEHTGMDSNALVSSFWGNLTGSSLRGGSTITMQLVSLLDPELKSSASKRKTLFQKFKQIQRAVELEETWTKEEIFTAYINLIYFRGELKGITSASKGLFRKSPEALTPNETYLLAALIRSPQSSIEKVIQRVCLLKKERDGANDCESISQLVRESLFRNFDYPQYPSFVPLYTKTILDFSKEEDKNKSQFNSSLSLNFQRKVEEILKRNVKTLANKNVKDGAVIVIENRTGQVLVYVPNIGEESSVSKLDLIRSKRQVGSTLKPFVYAENFQENKLTPDSILSDSPVGIPVYQGIYRPLNYDKSYKGNVTVRESLGSSLNIPAIRALSFLDINEFVLVLEKLGITGLRYPEFYGPSLALGTADITLLELTNAYRTLANGGIYSELKFDRSEDIIHSRRVFSPKSSYMVSEILADREARSLGFGWDNFLSTSYYTSVKTGTSQDMRDNWCIGYSEIYTVGVWVGNPTGSPMLDVSGITGAAPVWRETMDLFHESIGSKLTPPTEESSLELGFVSSKESRLEKTRSTRILTPVNGSIFALDPDIPLGRQKILFTFSSYDVSYSYYLNDEKIGSVGGPYLWEPKKGEYRLQVKDKDGKLLSLSLFEVR
ncbi:penicillin-binding protein 1C [Leptospira congkakensis]|uniref:peptidoglycan glycosyltransferase n=1 Tax=Leptospira congkakensis TaxID=2484932 RepID=A0A4Z1ACH8_9LEPT|nr:penicillin-binding protein 1C [Leptospira congkakensis]TGL85143.1 penicillin-binding protein 1C [Leptospira congkakensis]TGL92915.1 penicillin-binding protein 1C [Leptospira congkakensis]TGL96102.1 penicillin-binding protein 1C [Leptospira congkakensis]